MGKKKMALPEEILDKFREFGREGGKLGGTLGDPKKKGKGGATAAANMTPEERKARAVKASKAAAKARTERAKAKRKGA